MEIENRSFLFHNRPLSEPYNTNTASLSDRQHQSLRFYVSHGLGEADLIRLT